MLDIAIGPAHSLGGQLKLRMHADRKSVFIDRMRWDIHHRDGLEIDQFDNDAAQYVILSDSVSHRHLASARLLPTDRPHLLDTLFPMLCDASPPTGPEIFELTRFCVTPHIGARHRMMLRDQLFSTLVEHALLHGIRSYTGVTHLSFLSQVLGMGWRCDMLGMPRETGCGTIGAVQAHIGPETIGLMRRAGTYRSLPMTAAINGSLAA